MEKLAMIAVDIHLGHGTGNTSSSYTSHLGVRGAEMHKDSQRQDAESGFPSMCLRLVSVLTVAGLHIAAGYALLQVEAVRQTVEEAAPLFVAFIGPAVAPSAPPIVTPKVVVLPEQKTPPVLIATPTLDETPTTVEASPLAAPPVPISPILDVAVATVITAPHATPAPSTPEPKLVSGVEYVRPPQPEYPMLSRRMNEEGRVIVRVLINPQGRPEQALVQFSSRSSRLDQAAINAALAALFKPYTENGVALYAYALIPITFALTQ